MPNYCANLLSIPPRPGLLRADIDAVIQRLRGPNGPLDFETILPIPEALRNICRGGTLIDGQYHTLWREEPLPGGGVRKRPVSPGEQSRLRKEHGAADPIDWSILHWGSKWNAETWGGDWDFNAIRFDTAWNPPCGLVGALSRVFPDTQFEICFVEPGVCLNGRRIYYRGQEWQSEDYNMDSDAGRENAERVGLCLPEPEDEPELVEA